MNRVIKFRVWDKALKKFVNFDSLPVIDFNSELYIFQQFTGLLDKCRKEIYHGDIVCALSSDNKYLSIIEWSHSDGMWGFKSIKCKNMSFNYNLNYGCSDWEIKGNIFENPELL